MIGQVIVRSERAAHQSAALFYMVYPVVYAGATKISSSTRFRAATSAGSASCSRNYPCFHLDTRSYRDFRLRQALVHIDPDDVTITKLPYTLSRELIQKRIFVSL
jgi:hypothetical protein